VALFPDVIGKSREILRIDGIKSSLTAGLTPTRYRKFLRPREGFALSWTQLTPAEALQINDHVIAHAGARLSFEWYDWTTFFWRWLSIGTGTGASAVYDIPGKSSSEQEFYYVSGGELSTVAGTVSYGTGTHSADQVTLTAPSGAKVGCSATMRRLFTMTFEDDDQSLAVELDTGYYAFSTRLWEVK